MSQSAIKREARDGVAIFIIGGEEADAVMEQMREKNPPGLTIESRDVYWAIEAPNGLSIDLADLSDRLGRDIQVSDFLVFLASYYGRIVIDENTFSVVTEMIGTEPATA